MGAVVMVWDPDRCRRLRNQCLRTRNAAEERGDKRLADEMDALARWWDARMIHLDLKRNVWWRRAVRWVLFRIGVL